MSDTSASLLERLSNQSDSDAWRRLVDLYSPLINGWLRRQDVSADEVEDLTQEVLEVVVREVSRFRHNGRVGAFRTWLRTITVNCLRRALRSGRFRIQAAGSPDIAALLDQLEDPASELSRLWDREHDQHVLQRMLALIEPDFRPATWQAFHRQMLREAPPEVVAAELGMTVNAVLIAKSRVLSRLRRDAEGLVD